MRTRQIVRSFLMLLTVGVVLGSGTARAQSSAFPDEVAQIMRADGEFAQSVATKNRERFLSFIADVTTFNGGSQNELHGRDAVMKEWETFFTPDGPVLAWTPTRGEVVGAGDLGYTTGRSTLTVKGPDGRVAERHGEYVTVWKKQRDGTWKVIFDTGSTLPVAPQR